MNKPKNQRFFLAKGVDSYVKLTTEDGWSVELKMADCRRVVEWSFNVSDAKGLKASIKKLARFRQMVDELHDWMSEELERKEARS